MEVTENIIERFLLDLECNKEYVFAECPDYVVLNVIPFFQLAYVLNLVDTLKMMQFIANEFSGKLIFVGGFIAMALDEVNVNKEMMRYLASQLYCQMRF